MKSKNIKVAYSTRYPQKGMSIVPKIQMEGKWLEELGFSVGSTIMVEYEEGSIRIRPLTAEELALKEQQELQTELKRKTAELHSIQCHLQKEHNLLSKVAEPATIYKA